MKVTIYKILTVTINNKRFRGQGVHLYLGLSQNYYSDESIKSLYWYFILFSKKKNTGDNYL